MISRDQAWSVLAEFTQSDSLRKHARAVEASMRAYAVRYDEDVEAWGVAGMLHDFVEHFVDVVGFVVDGQGSQIS